MAGRKAFPLRLSQDLYEELQRWAADELRSVNGQIEYLLRQAVATRRGARTHGRGPPRASDQGRDQDSGQR
jgi:hypothetical protein